MTENQQPAAGGKACDRAGINTPAIRWEFRHSITLIKEATHMGVLQHTRAIHAQSFMKGWYYYEEVSCDDFEHHAAGSALRELG